MILDEDKRAQKYPFLKDRPVQYYFTRFMNNRRESNDYVCVLEDNQEPVDFHRTVNSFNQCPLTLKGTLSLVHFTPIVIKKLNLEVRRLLKLPSSVYDWKLVKQGYMERDRSQYLSFCRIGLC